MTTRRLPKPPAAMCAECGERPRAFERTLCSPCKNRRWQASNPAGYRAAKRRWYKRHREAVIRASVERRRAWPDEYRRERRRVHMATRRARLRDAPGVATFEQVAARIAYYGGLCWICRRAPWTDLDHVIPLARGGSNWPANLRPACR